MYFLQKDDIMLHFTQKGSSDITGFHIQNMTYFFEKIKSQKNALIKVIFASRILREKMNFINMNTKWLNRRKKLFLLLIIK